MIEVAIRRYRDRIATSITVLVLVLCSGAGTARAAPVEAAPAASTALFHLNDPRLDEISGIAAGIASPDVVYVENDGGDSARFFALDKRTGAVLATYDVPGAKNVDWEDIAVAPDARGTPSVWLADIGDNDAARRSIRLYRVDEPHVDVADGSNTDAEQSTGPPQVWTLQYPGGPRDAESLAVSAAGVPYVITKSLLGRSVVYAGPARPGSGSLRQVGTITFGFTGTPGPFGPVGGLTATGADFSRGDPARLVVRTYTDAYLWTMNGGDVSAALRKPGQRLALPQQPQGEGICFDGSRLLTDSENVGSAVYALAIPPMPLGGSPTDSSGSTSAPSPPPTPTKQDTSTADAGASGTDSGAGGWWWAGAGAVILFIVVFVGGLALSRRRRSHG